MTVFRSFAALTGVALLLSACGEPAPAAQEQETARAKNVILFVGDGMGVSTVTGIRILDGQLKGMQGEENVLSFEKFDHVALSKTYNTNQQVPDSAGTASAMFTGAKTKAGFISVGEQAELGNCASAKDATLKTLLEHAEERGLATGVVTTTRVTHATPAAGYAHVPHRNWESDANLPEEAAEQGCRDIARQLLEFSYGDGLEVVMGGGRREFLPETQQDPAKSELTGRRKDGRDLTAEWAQSRDDAAYIWNYEQFLALDAAQTGRLLALFNPTHMLYERERRQEMQHPEPSLTEMTEKALAVLSRHEQGYVLLVEGGRIDHGHHAGSAYHALHDGVAFNAAVERALELTDPAETLILVTADHSHTFTIAGYPTRGNPILGKVVANDTRGNPRAVPVLAADEKPYTTVGYYAAGDAELADSIRADLSEVDTTAADFRQQAAIPFESGQHGGEDVAIYAHGTGAEQVRGVMEQNRIFNIMFNALWGESKDAEAP